ncbi:hypothetical protein BOTBODRAFT_59456 [Botryobasidium botryosum FD-172 SS1]|uniref:Glutamyl-tRNA(Gln) amidotransferase subunit B, mitochondrial n=1 Tax=Botryobasidium botryosum (strain FD-172 SS1) TaxID=930990 RepID=A0A067M0P8_BOTB1|nr:hypothetical protein BOTBODRAFT_59456 [Botryobasidium botryosum FD-172 SS1]
MLPMFQATCATHRTRLVLFRRYSSSLGDTRWPGWQPVIGIEVHAQIKSREKLFSESLAAIDGQPNTRVSLFDAAFPGTLPRLNPKCVQLACRAAVALSSEIQHRSAFDRKHYFYPDLPSGYQITQNYAPLAKGGELRLRRFDRIVRIKQIQLEQDTAKSTSDPKAGKTRIDLNRAGTGLMEIVSEPDMRSPEEAGAYVRELQGLLRCVGASDGNMDEGSLRCDVNVSVSRVGEGFGTRCEVKNLNSVRFLQSAIISEIGRQIQLLESGRAVPQDTRGFDEDSAETYKLRSKEDAPDYRYMPDPNLPPLILDQSFIAQIRECTPALPAVTLARLQSEYGLTLRDAEVLMSIDAGSEVGFDGEPSPGGAVRYFESVAHGRDAKAAVNWITHELLGQLAARKESFAENPVSAHTMGELIDLVASGEITSTSGKALLRYIIQKKTTTPLGELLDTLSLRALDSSSDTLPGLCEAAIAALPSEADAVRKGNERVLMKIIGWVMRQSGGRVDAKKAAELLKERLRGENGGSAKDA